MIHADKLKKQIQETTAHLKMLKTEYRLHRLNVEQHFGPGACFQKDGHADYPICVLVCSQNAPSSAEMRWSLIELGETEELGCFGGGFINTPANVLRHTMIKFLKQGGFEYIGKVKYAGKMKVKLDENLPKLPDKS